MDKHDIPTRLGVNSLRFSYRVESDYPGEDESTNSIGENTLRIAHSDPLYGAMRVHGWVNTPAGPASDLVLTQTIINTVDTAAILFTDPDLITFSADIETTTWNLQNTSSIDVDGVLLPPSSDIAAITWEVADIQDVSVYGEVLPPSTDLEAITWEVADIQDVDVYGEFIHTPIADIEAITWQINDEQDVLLSGALLPPSSDIEAITWQINDIQDTLVHGAVLPPSADIEAITWQINDIQDVSLHGSVLPKVSDLTTTSISAISIDVQASTSSTATLPTQLHTNIITNSNSDLSYKNFGGNESEIIPRNVLYVGWTLANVPTSSRSTTLSFSLPNDMGVSTVIESAKIQFTASGTWNYSSNIQLRPNIAPAGHVFIGGNSNWFTGVNGTGLTGGYQQDIDDTGVVAGQRDDQTALTNVAEAIYSVISHPLYTPGDNIVFILHQFGGTAQNWEVASESHGLYDAPELFITYTP